MAPSTTMVVLLWLLLMFVVDDGDVDDDDGGGGGVDMWLYHISSLLLVLGARVLHYVDVVLLHASH